MSQHSGLHLGEMSILLALAGGLLPLLVLENSFSGCLQYQHKLRAWRRQSRMKQTEELHQPLLTCIRDMIQQGKLRTRKGQNYSRSKWKSTLSTNDPVSRACATHIALIEGVKRFLQLYI